MGAKTRETPHPLIVKLNTYARQERMTNTGLAAVLGCDQSTVSRFRRRGRQPKNRLVRANLRKLLGLPPEGAK